MTEEIQQRVTNLEGEMAIVRLMATSADQEASAVRAALRAHNQSLHALRQTQLEQGTRIDLLDSRVGRLECTAEEGFAEMREGFAKLNLGQAQITALLTGQLGSCESSD
jgi:hypothetical protein